MLWLTSMVLVMNAGTNPDLAALRYQSRVLLIFALEATDAAFVQQRQWLVSKSADLQERDLKVFEIVGLDANAQQLRSEFKITGAHSFAAVLIGKDGGQKLYKTAPVTPEVLFRLIDSMPMRKNEMRQSK